MKEVLVGLSIAYVFIAALLLMVLVYGRIRWFYKLALVLVSVGFYWTSYSHWMDAQGWPSDRAMPQRFLFHYVIVEEPNEREGDKGRFFVWATSLVQNRPSPEPRAYVIPYDQGLHAEFDKAMRKQRNGNLQIGEVGGELFDPAEARDFTRLADQKITLEFTDLPDPQLPEK